MVLVPRHAWKGCFCALLACAHLLDAASLKPDFEDTRVATGLPAPTAMALAPDGRWFVCTQGGELRVIKNGALLSTPFLTVSVDSSGERGLLGVTFDPDFAVNHYVYVYYTTPAPAAHNRISRFTAQGDVAATGSEVVLMELPDLSAATNHNGGALHFGPDGKLYVGVGENGNGSNSQTLANPLGKLLRINSDGSIPADNPFFLTATGQGQAIWALGLRNPFTFAFHPLSGRLFINDVGQNLWEEIDDGVAGANYGWPATEGYTQDPQYKTPLYAYGHGADNATGCAIAGGAFYAPSASQFPAAYEGHYFFADLCGGWIRELDPSDASTAIFATGISFPVDVRVGPEGCLYYLERGPTLGSLHRVCYNVGYRTPTGGWRDIYSTLRLTAYSSYQAPGAGGVLASDPSVAQSSMGDTFAVGRDTFNAVWVNVFDADQQDWGNWAFAGGSVQGMPAVTVAGDTAYFAARDTGNAYWINRYDPQNGFGGWQNLGGVFASDPAMDAAPDGSIYVVGRDSFGAIWSGRYLSGAGFQGWRFGGAVTQGQPSVAAGSDNAAYIAVRDTSSSLWMGRVMHESWNGWFPGGGVLGADPHTAAAAGQIYVAATEPSNGVWFQIYTEGTTDGFQGWKYTGGLLTDVGVAGGTGGAFLVGRDTNAAIWWYRTETGQWTYAGFLGLAAGPIEGAR